MRYLQPAAFLMLLMGSSTPFLSQAAIAAPEEDEVSKDVASGSRPLSEDSSPLTDEVQQGKLQFVEVADAIDDESAKGLDLAAMLDSAQGSPDKVQLLRRVLSTNLPVQDAADDVADDDVAADNVAADESGIVIPVVSAVRSPRFSQSEQSLQSDLPVLTGRQEDALLAQQPPSRRLTLESLRQLINSANSEASTEASTEVVTEASTSELPTAEVAQSTPPPEPVSEDLPTLELPSSEPADESPAEPSAAPAEPAVDEVPGDDIPDEVEGTSVESVPEETPEAPPALPPEIPASPEIPAPETPENAAPQPQPSTAEEDASSEIGALPDILFADPNPLNVPTSPEDVELDKTPTITLEQAVDLAYRNNQTLQGAILTLEQSEAAVREANASRLPDATVGATLTNTQRDSDSTTSLGGQVEISYDILTGGSRSATIRSAELQRDISALAVETQQEQIRLVTSNLYYALQESGEQIRINQAFVNEAERNLRDAKLREEVGVGTTFDVLRAEVQFANARQSLIQSQGDQRIARRDIARLLNLPPTSGIEATPVAVAEDWPMTLEESIVLALQNRAELEQQLLQTDLSEQQRRLALSVVRPQLDVFARYSASDVLGDAPFGVDPDFNDDVVVGARFNMILFDGGAARASARQQELNAEIAEEQFSENVDQFRFEVEQAFFNLESNKENIATSRIAVAQAEEALGLANLRLQEGVGTQLDVLTAQSELTQAESNNVTAILGYNRALAAMQRAVSNLGLFIPQ